MSEQASNETQEPQKSECATSVQTGDETEQLGSEGDGKPRPATSADAASIGAKQVVFLSYNFDDEAFVKKVSLCLKAQPALAPYFYGDEIRLDREWSKEVEKPLKSCHIFVLFLGASLGRFQEREAEIAEGRAKNEACRLVVVKLPNGGNLNDRVGLLKLPKLDPLRVSSLDDATAEECAKTIVTNLGFAWTPMWCIPDGYPFGYEKDIINEFMREENGKARGKLSKDRVAEGCPESWPKVARYEPACRFPFRRNPFSDDTVGPFRDCYAKDDRRYLDEKRRDPQVVAAALTACHDPECRICLVQDGCRLTFPEAGPRLDHVYPRSKNNSLTVGILVSGGIAPGINAVISGIVDRHRLYAEEVRSKDNVGDLQIICYREGLHSLAQRGKTRGPNFEVVTLGDSDKLDTLTHQAQEGGSQITTSRSADLLDPTKRDEALRNTIAALKNDGVEILYIIGGDGGMKAAHAIQQYARRTGYNISVIGVPKAMDNDILWVWQSFGFLSAVESATGTVRHLYTEATSNPRVCVIQLFGSDSGFVVCHAALASGVCDLVLIPEVDFEIRPVMEHIKDKLLRRHRSGFNARSPYGIVLMAETAIPRDIMKWLDKEGKSSLGPTDDEEGDPTFGLTRKEIEAVRQFFTVSRRRIHGQTPDTLRQAGLKIVTGTIKKAIDELKTNDPYWEDFRVFDNQPRHLIRATPTIASDIIYGQRLGILAADCAMAGYHDFMISQWLTEYVMVPLELVVLGRKRVPSGGMFWKSVLASTGQPPNMAPGTDI